MDRTRTVGPLLSLVLWLVAVAANPAIAQQDEESKKRGGVSGSVEVLYRNINVDGSTRKYDEDFDALTSGARLADATVHWNARKPGFVDYARLNVSGLGGDPYERTWFRTGRKGKYELSLLNWTQDYTYNLFELVPDEDGQRWDSQRQLTQIGLDYDVNRTIKLVFEYRQGSRTGSSLFMKDIEKNLFRLETPLDYDVKHYTVGGDFRIGRVNLLFRQTFRRYTNTFNNSTEGDLGLEEGGALLYDYDWLQLEQGDSDWTRLVVNTPLGGRVNLTLGLLGTYLGSDDLTSDVHVEQLGVDEDGNGFGGLCLANPATSCGSDSACPAGDVCVPLQGASSATLEGDTSLIDVDLSVRLHRTVDLHFQYRLLERDLRGQLQRDLDGDGAPEDPDGDGVPGSSTVNDYEISTLTGQLDYRPVRQFRVRLGYRTIERELERSGFGMNFRSLDYDSGDDDTVIFGFVLKPVKWFWMNADYEDGDIVQPFTATAPQERRHGRAQVNFEPLEGGRLQLAYRQSETSNRASDFRAPTQNWNSELDGRAWSASWLHQAGPDLDYLVRYSKQEMDSNVRVTFDLGPPGFNVFENGNSIFVNDNQHVMARVNFGFATAWRGFAWASYTDSDGSDSLIGDVSPQPVNNVRIAQEFLNAEIGVSYTFRSGIFAGGSLRAFDYDDVNDLLDYNGEMFIVRLGSTF